MSEPSEDTELEPAQHQRRRSLWGPWAARSTSVTRPRVPEDAVTAPDSPAAIAPVAALPRARQPANFQSSSSSTSGELLPIGHVVGGRYVIEQHISSGGFGAVYRASDRDIRHHQVALKLLHHRAASEEERQGALRELKLLATVTHPSVVQFKEYGWHDGRFWFAMPWYRGRTLDRIVDDGTGSMGLSRAEARPLFTRLAHGLAAMHAVGIHHHDIKPENIFVAEIAGFPGGLPVLLDLGIATQRGEHPVGLTVEYASPETAAAMLGDATRTIGGAADVYSLALVLRNVLDPSLAESASTSQIKPMLRARATQQALISNKRDLAYLKPHFKRWLHQDPNQRPTAAELASELQILTEPEERYQNRVRFVQRVAPGVLLFGLMLGGLALQLNRKETALVVQRRALEQERREGEALRKQAAAQLDQLDESARTLGDERKLLKRTLSLARTLNERLSDAAARFEELERKKSDLSKERDELLALRDRLTVERDDQIAAQATLLKEREKLTADRDQLNLQLIALGEERDNLKKEQSRLSDELERGQAELTSREERLELLTKERERLTVEVRERDQRVDALSAERTEALAEVRELKNRLARAEARIDAQPRKPQKAAPRPAAAKAGKKKVRRRVR